MTPNRLAAIAFRWSISAVFTLWLFAANAEAQSAATAINGVYNGSYTCALGPRALKLSLLASGKGSLTGVFTFYLPPTSHTQAFSYSMSGTFDAASGKFKLNPVKWEVPPPGSYSMVGMDGAFDPGTGQVAGRITNGSCGAFQATRDQAESANMTSIIAPQKVAGAAQPPPKTVVPAVPPPQNAALNQKPCNFLTKAEAESILGESVVQRRDSDYECWFVQNAFAGGTGANNKQIDLSIWRSPAPKPDDVNSRRAGIAGNRGMAGIAVRDVADFADAALWSWTPRWGRFNAFKGGTSEVEVTISGIDEAAALQNAKKLAARALGGAGKTGYAYARPGTAPAPMPVQSPASYGAAWMGQDRVIRGTVSRVSVRFGARPYWLTIFFKESPDAAFVVCSPYPDMFQETVGDLYRLVGKTLEVTGQVEDSMCAGKAASIRVVDSQHYRVEGLQALATGHVAVRPVRDSAHPYVGLDICNAGKVDLDALLVKQSGVASRHIAPRDCAHVYEENGATPAFVGFAFADSHGQWGTARRLDLLPDFGIDVLTRADRNVSVRRGSKDVSAQLQLLFRPRNPSCRKNIPYSARARLPWNATATQKSIAESEDESRAKTVCESLDYGLNVVAYPDTREVTFEKKCFECPPAPALTELTKQQAIGTISRISPEAGRIMGGAAAQQEEQALKESLEGPPEFQRMNWNEMSLALAKVRPSGGRPPEMPEYLIVRGTVSRVDVSPPGASEHWVDVYFRESSEQASSVYETSYGAFNVCASDAGIFEDMFGKDFRTRMIGQVLEIEGEYQRYYCKGFKGSIRVSLAHQVHSVGAAH